LIAKYSNNNDKRADKHVKYVSAEP